MLPALRRLVGDQPSEAAAKIVTLLHRLYDFRDNEVPYSTGWNKGYIYPPLDLSSSGLSDSLLSELIKKLKLQYCDTLPDSTGLSKQSTLTSAFLQHIDLSNNQLKPTSRVARQLIPSASQHLAVWLSHPSCRLQSLNLSDNPALGGSGSIYAIGWGSDIYHIIQALFYNECLEILRMANTGINGVDFEALAKMLSDNARLRVVDITNNPITLDGRSHYRSMLEKRYKNNHPVLSLVLEKTGLLEPVAVQGPRSLESSKTIPIDPVRILGANNPLEAFQLELFLQLKYFHLRTVGERIFAQYKPEHYPAAMDYYVKLVHVLIIALGGLGTVVSPLATLIGALTKAIGFPGIVHKAEALIEGIKSFFETVTPEEEKLLSLENLHLLYEVIKDGLKGGKKVKEQYTKLMALGKKLSNSSPAAKEAIDTLHAQYYAIVKLFINSKSLRTKIVMALSHGYYPMILRLNTEEAVRFAKELGSIIEPGLLGLSLSGDITVDEMPDLLLKNVQMMSLDLFQTIRFRHVVHQGYVRQREKSFSDIFGITRAQALKQIMEHPKPEDFKGIKVSLSEMLVKRALDTYFVPALPIYFNRTLPRRVDFYDSLSDSIADNDLTFTLDELITLHRNPPKKVTAKRRQLATLFFTLQSGGQDQCCWHPALLQALARLQGFTLKIWEYSNKEGKPIVPYFEDSCASYEHPGSKKRIDCVDETEVEKDERNGQITVAIKFSQIQLAGYGTDSIQVVSFTSEPVGKKEILEKDPSATSQSEPAFLETHQNALTHSQVRALSHDQIRENEASMVWVRDLLQRSGCECAGNIRFDISKKMNSQAGKEWTQTDRAKLGCLRASQTMLNTVNLMVKEYKAQVSQSHFSILYNDQCYQITSLTPLAQDKTPLQAMLNEPLSEAIARMIEHYGTIKTLIQPLIEDEFLLDSPTFPYTLWGEDLWWNMISRPWKIFNLHKVFLEYRSAHFMKSSWKTYWTLKLKYHINDTDIADKFLRFTLEMRQLHGGWIHPNILRALAMVLAIRLEFYQLDESGEMSPHPHYTNVCPKEPKKTVRLLYLDTYRHLLLSDPVTLEYVPVDPFRWTCDNALVSRCGLYKLSVSTLKELVNAGELKAIESPFVIEEISERLDKLTAEVKELRKRLDKLEPQVEALEVEQKRQGAEVSELKGKVTVLEQKGVVRPEEAQAAEQRIAELEGQTKKLVEEAKESAKKLVEAEKRVEAAEGKAKEAITRAEKAEATIQGMQREL